MPREYQLKTTGNTLPHNVYMQVIYIIKDYHRMVNERQNIMHGSPCSDGQPRGNKTSDTTADKAVKLSALSDRVDGIDRALHDVGCHFANQISRDDVEYFDCLEAFDREHGYGYFCYALYDPLAEEGKEEPSKKSWQRFRKLLACEIARNLKII